MADIKLIKTTDISRVTPVPNQLIFVDDGSIYFDYKDGLRLHNAGGANVADWKAGKEYLKNDLAIYNGALCRALLDCKDSTFVSSHWQLFSETGSGTGGGGSSAISVVYDPSASGLPAVTVQEAIDSLASLINNLSSDLGPLSSQVEDLEEKQENDSQRITQIEETVLYSDAVFELDTF